MILRIWREEERGKRIGEGGELRWEGVDIRGCVCIRRIVEEDC